MDMVIPHQLHDQVFVYIDDLLVVSSDFEHHLQLLNIVAGHLRKAGLTINVEKSKFCLTKVKYLEYIIGDGCVKTDSGKVSVINDFPKPTPVKQIRRFLGMAGRYRRFIENVSTISSPLTDLTRSKVFAWNEEADEAFVSFKRVLTIAPVLARPDFTKHFFIQCDAVTVQVVYCFK